MDVIHTAIQVSDLDAALAFYVDGLGLSQTNEFERDGVRNVYVGSDDGAEIQFKFDPEATESVAPAGIDHLALAVDDLDAEFERLCAATDCPVRVEPMDVPVADARVAFVEDPNGYVVELVAYEA